MRPGESESKLREDRHPEYLVAEVPFILEPCIFRDVSFLVEKTPLESCDLLTSLQVHTAPDPYYQACKNYFLVMRLRNRLTHSATTFPDFWVMLPRQALSLRWNFHRFPAT